MRGWRVMVVWAVLASATARADSGGAPGTLGGDGTPGTAGTAGSGMQGTIGAPGNLAQPGDVTTAPAPDALEGSIDPTRYVVGPGDRVRLELWGLKDLQEELEVTAEGRLVVPRAGVFDAGGKTLAALRAAVEAKLHSIYPQLASSLTLARPRTFVVHVTGAVARPGSYQAMPMTRVSALLPKAGGALPWGSLRRVEIRRRGVATPIIADLARFALLGQLDADPLLLDGDTLYVPPRQLTVEVSGGVRRPGSYELTATHTLSELLELAGGLAPTAAEAAPVRIVSRAAGSDRVAERTVALAAASSTALGDGDRVHVAELAEAQPTVLVQGALAGPATPGEPQRPPGLDLRPDQPPREVSLSLPYVVGEGVRELVLQAGGLAPWADGRRAYLTRRAADGTPRRVELDVVSITTGQLHNVPVEPGDTLTVPSRRDQVMVSGAVQRPGSYPYSSDLKPRDYLSLAGGPTRSGDASHARVLQNGVERALSKVVSVGPGDVITVPEHTFTAADWITISLVLGNIALGAAALGVAAAK